MKKKFLMTGLILCTITNQANSAAQCDMETIDNCALMKFCTDVANQNYEKCVRGKLDANCVCIAGTALLAYQCKAGYYGTASRTEPTCTQCPSLGSAIGSSDSNTSTIDGCYIAKGSYSDGTGNFDITNSCQY